MELTGTVTLDQKSMDDLKYQIRQEVIEDIRLNGNYPSEIERYMNDSDFKSYIRMIECTIGNIVEKINEEDIRFDSDRKAYHRIMAIKSLMDIE